MWGAIAGIASNVVSGVLSNLGTSMLSQLFSGGAADLGSKLLQGIGERLGVPQSIIDAAQGIFHNALGDTAGARQNYQEALDQLSPMDRAHHDAQAKDALNDLIMCGARQGTDASESDEGESWLMALAGAMAEKINAQKEDVLELEGKVTGDDAGATARFSAASQELNLMMTTSQNVIKTLGDGLAALARK